MSSNDDTTQTTERAAADFREAQARLTTSLREADLRHARKLLADAEKQVAAAHQKLDAAKRGLARLEASA